MEALLFSDKSEKFLCTQESFRNPADKNTSVGLCLYGNICASRSNSTLLWKSDKISWSVSFSPKSFGWTGGIYKRKKIYEILNKIKITYLSTEKIYYFYLSGVDILFLIKSNINVSWVYRQTVFSV